MVIHNNIETIEVDKRNLSEESSKQYKCSICGLSFESLGGLQTHMTDHLQKGEAIPEEKWHKV